MMFVAGQKVTRTDDNPWKAWEPHRAALDIARPEYGAVYIVTQAFIHPMWDLEFLHLDGFLEVYDARSFRPIVEKKLPECLTRLLGAPITEPIGG